MKTLLATLMAGTLLAAAHAQDAAYRTALPWERGATVFGELSEGRYQGRRLSLRAASVGIAPSERIAFWVGDSEATAYGRSSESRFRLEASGFTVRYRLGAHRGTEFAVQADHVRPGDAVSTAKGPGTTIRTVYRATRLYSGDLIASRGAFDAALGFGFVDSAAEDGSYASASFGYRRPVARDLSIWAQGTLIGQSGDGSSVKGVLRGQLRYAPVPWGAATLEGTLFTNGLPYGDPLGSFLLYNPSGSAAQGLKSNALGYGTLRLSFTAKF